MDRKTISAVAAALVLALVVAAAQFTSTARADTSASCADAVTTAPTGPATVSAQTKAPFGKVLVVGSGAYAGCSLYLLTSDQLHALTGADFACSDNANALGAACDTILWPALLTEGAPIAGPGVNPTLLGTVTRTDMGGLPAVQQVTYAGQPLYRFVFDESSDEIEGANLFDPVTSPTGTWYMVDPSRGQNAPGQAQLRAEIAPLDGTGPDETVVAAAMNNGFSLFPDASFPVYTLSSDSGHRSACQGVCAQSWLPVLTDKAPLGEATSTPTRWDHREAGRHASGDLQRQALVPVRRRCVYRGPPVRRRPHRRRRRVHRVGHVQRHRVAIAM